MDLASVFSLLLIFSLGVHVLLLCQLLHHHRVLFLDLLNPFLFVIHSLPSHIPQPFPPSPPSPPPDPHDFVTYYKLSSRWLLPEDDTGALRGRQVRGRRERRDDERDFSRTWT